MTEDGYFNSLEDALQLMRELRQHCLEPAQEGEDIRATIASNLGTFLLNVKS